MSPPVAVVTGAGGWLGRRLVRALVHGLEDVPGLGGAARPVRALVHGEGPLEEEGVAVIRGDVVTGAGLDELFQEAAGGTVFHAAGLIHPRLLVRDLHAVNVEGTRRVLEAARRAGVRRVVHVSSNSPVGTNPHPEHRFDEESPCRPYLGYGASKLRAEELVRAAAADLETVIVRPPWFYGPGQPPRQTLFFKMVRTGRFPLLGGGHNVRSMVYVDNLCQGLLLAERVPEAAGRTFWIADRRAYPMHEVVATVAAVLREDFGMQVAPRPLRLPGFVGTLAEWADRALQAVGLYHQKIHVLGELDKTIACRVTRAERELGYDPKVALREGMARSVRWVLDQGLEI